MTSGVPYISQELQRVWPVGIPHVKADFGFGFGFGGDVRRKVTVACRGMSDQIGSSWLVWRSSTVIGQSSLHLLHDHREFGAASPTALDGMPGSFG
jgi:hypothetical protein